MQQRFEKQPKIELDPPGTAIVAYGYLQASVRFKIPYFDNREEFLFCEPDGKGATPFCGHGYWQSTGTA
jgi:hypothetical protein